MVHFGTQKTCSQSNSLTTTIVEKYGSFWYPENMFTEVGLTEQKRVFIHFLMQNLNKYNTLHNN